ncbi:MAG: gliding motility-associated protein GldE [Chitinophagaceae bacterium]|nr:MAG: gliding motility-associated protein GldE [Chitinophagaceae bacterium]
MESSLSDGDYEQRFGLLIQFIAPLSPELLIVGILILILIVCSSLVSGSEVAFFSLNNNHFQELKNNYHTAGDTLIKLLEKPRYLLATILISNNLINISIIILSYFLFESLFDFTGNELLGFLINVIGITFVLVLLGEVVPKVYATEHNLKFALFMSLPLLFLTKLFKPISYIMVKSSGVIERRFQDKQHNITISDLNEAIDITVKPSDDKEEIKILKGLVKFGNITVKQIMTARVDMVAVDEKSSLKEILELIKESGFSRIPVFKEDVDHISGILHVKDIIRILEHEDDLNYDWRPIIRNAFYVPETKKIDDLLEEIQSNRNHMAIVVDEYGGTSGLVTLEDILEEVVGDIQDEFDDKDELNYTRIDKNTFIFDGKTQINDFCRYLSIDTTTFDDVKQDADSLAGLVLELSGRFLKKNESIQYENFRFTVISIDKFRIENIKVTILDGEVS